MGLYYSKISQFKYSLAEKPFAAGGEGGIYAVDGRDDIVAKIYNADKRTDEREYKICAMLSTAYDSMKNYAWPMDILYSYENGSFMGYIMRRVSGEKLIDFYVADKRHEKDDPKKDISWALFISVARNLSAAVYNIHEVGHVIGDLNPNNIICDINTGIVTLVDTDSYHIKAPSGRILRCEVGTGEFTPKELQGIRFADCPVEQSYNIYTDNFALAVLIFRILMGAHPYVCRSTDGSDTLNFSIEENIKNGFCIYFQKPEGMDIPLYAPKIDSLPQYLQVLFYRAFVDGTDNPQLRPTAIEWYNALNRLYSELGVCDKNRSHYFYKDATECPWCEIKERFEAELKLATAEYPTKAKVKVKVSPTESTPIIKSSASTVNKAAPPKLCRICKKPVAENAERCDYCGAKQVVASNPYENTKRNCSVCGSTIPSGVKKCPYCGYEKMPVPAKKRSPTMLVVIISLIVIVAAIVTTIIIVNVINSGDDSSQPPEQTNASAVLCSLNYNEPEEYSLQVHIQKSTVAAECSS